jgi:hypothetical protein
MSNNLVFKSLSIFTLAQYKNQNIDSFSRLYPTGKFNPVFGLKINL